MGGSKRNKAACADKARPIPTFTGMSERTPHGQPGLSSEADDERITPYDAEMNLDPTTSNPDLYKVIFENDRVRVLEYKDAPGASTTPHVHPDSVMYTLSSFKRRLASGGREVDVEINAG